MLKYKCLVLDHDDTVVQTERYIGFPYFKDYIEKIRPGQTVHFEEYVKDCSGMVFADMCKARWNMTDEECAAEYTGWCAYYSSHHHPIFPGIDRIIQRQKEEGGLVCVVSLSPARDILRDYADYFIAFPDWAAAKGMRILGNPMGTDDRIVSGESGASAFGCMAAILTEPELADLKEKLGLDETSRVLFFSTEGDTDRENYRRIVWDGKFPGI